MKYNFCDAIAIGGLIEIVPTFLVKSNIPTITSVKPYTPLELEGRDIYVREGCYNCHSQMVRPFRSETERYGEYSKAGEFVYDSLRKTILRMDMPANSFHGNGVQEEFQYWIEGDAPRQRMLNKAPWTGRKIYKKLSKHSIFFGLSFLISNIFLAY